MVIAIVRTAPAARAGVRDESLRGMLGKLLPYLLLLPQMAITTVFFFWPAAQTVYQSVLQQDAFGTTTEFVGLENYDFLREDTVFWLSVFNTLVTALLGARAR